MMSKEEYDPASLAERGLVENGSARKFDEQTLPAGLLKEHALSEGNWAILRLLEGSVTFVDLASKQESEMVAPAARMIEPQEPHELKLSGPLKVELTFYKKR